MKIFISWSDETSHAIALTLGDWIPSVIQAVETTVSPEDIRKGTRWVNDVSKELNQTSLGILCVVPGNIGAPWLSFEAGALLKFLDISKVIPLLIDVERSELDNGPLAQFPSAIYEKNEMYHILETINENMEEGRLSEERLQNTFEVWWPKLKLDVESIRKKEINEIEHTGIPEEKPETEKPEEKPEKTPDADKPEKEPDTDKPEKKPDTEKPEKKPDTEKPEKKPDTDKPEKTPDADQPEKTPERTGKAGRKSETKKTQEPDKPKKSVPAKPVLEKIEIEMLKVLYEPPGYTPRTAATVGYKLDISAQKVKEHLDILERENYVREHLYVGRPKEFSLAPKGREYLTRNDLLNDRQDR
ncbi:MAG: hypothetical protein WBB46_00045 [Candidatus Deferrimicrobiaceae bacterium]